MAFGREAFSRCGYSRVLVELFAFFLSYLYDDLVMYSLILLEHDVGDGICDHSVISFLTHLFVSPGRGVQGGDIPRVRVVDCRGSSNGAVGRQPGMTAL